MAKFTIFTNKSFNAFLNGVGPAWEEYIAQGKTLPITLKLVPADWNPSEGSMIITDFDTKNEAEDRTAFHRHFPGVIPDFNVTNDNYPQCAAYHTNEVGSWDIVMISNVEIQMFDDGDSMVFADLRILHIPMIPSKR